VIAALMMFDSSANAQQKSSPDAVVKNLKAAVGDHFEVIGVKSAIGRRDMAYWLAEIKAKRPGDYMLRYGKRGYDQGEAIYYFTVAMEGTVRTRGHLHRETTISPMACVGDTLIVPLQAQSHDDLHLFVLKTGEEDKYYAPNWAAIVDGMKGKIEMRNEADKTIKLLKSADFSSVTRDVSHSIHRLTAAFEAIAPTKCNVRFALAAPKDGKDNQAGRGEGTELAVEIVKKDEPVRVLVPQWKLEQSRDYVEPASVQLRVGDRLLVCAGEHRTEFRSKDVKHPPMVVTQKEFAPLKPPFKAAAK
jgi:hypothetical protein